MLTHINTQDSLNQSHDKEYFLNIDPTCLDMPRRVSNLLEHYKPNLNDVVLCDNRPYAHLDSKELQYTIDEIHGLSNHSYLTDKQNGIVYSTPNVVGIEIYKNDTVVVRERFKRPNTWAIPKRGDIIEFSEHSRHRLAFVSNNANVDFESMITLTYPRNFPQNGIICKWHLRRFLKDLEIKFKGIKWLWFQEFQTRGAGHYHIMTDKPLTKNLIKKYRKGGKVEYLTVKRLHEWVARQWVKIVHKELSLFKDKRGNVYDKQDLSGSRELVATWQPDMTHDRVRDSFRVGTSWEKIRDKQGARKYVTKYAMKLEQKIVPDNFKQVGRFWGACGAVMQSVKPLAKLVGLSPMIKGMLQNFEVHEAVKRLERLPKILFNVGRVLLGDLDTVKGMLFELGEFRGYLKGFNKPVDLREIKPYYIQGVFLNWPISEVSNWYDVYMDCDMETTSNDYDLTLLRPQLNFR